MENFEGTFSKLDNLINKLQANTGAQPKHEKQLQIQQQTNVQIPKQQVKQLINQPIQPKVEEILQNKDKLGKQVQEDTKEKKKEKGQKKQKGEKGEKKQKEKGQKKQEKKEVIKEGAQGQQLGPKDFAQIDIRIGQIVECWKHPQSQNLYCQRISFCGEVREIASGLQKFVPLQNMKGKVIVMANLKPRPLAGFQSNGMVVCASNAEHTAVELIIPEGEIGERVYLQGFYDLFKSQNILPVLNPKKKILEKCGQFFKTDGEGFVVWKGIRLRTQAGPLKATIINGGVS